MSTFSLSLTTEMSLIKSAFNTPFGQLGDRQNYPIDNMEDLKKKYPMDAYNKAHAKSVAAGVAIAASRGQPHSGIEWSPSGSQARVGYGRGVKPALPVVELATDVLCVIL